MSINAEIKNTSKYSGKINVKAYKNGILYHNKEYHNTGTSKLCAYICDCLRGENVIAQRPGLLVPCSYNGAELVDLYNFDNQYEGYTVTKEEEGSGAYYTLSFIIPESLLLGVEQIDGFRLYSMNSNNQGKKLYAEVNLYTQSSPILVQDGSNLKVSWTLRVSI